MQIMILYLQTVIHTVVPLNTVWGFYQYHIDCKPVTICGSSTGQRGVGKDTYNEWLP